MNEQKKTKNKQKSTAVVKQSFYLVMNGRGVDAALLVEVPDAAELGSFRAPAAVRGEAVRAQEQVCKGPRG